MKALGFGRQGTSRLVERGNKTEAVLKRSRNGGLQKDRNALVSQVLFYLADTEEAIVKHRRGQEY